MDPYPGEVWLAAKSVANRSRISYVISMSTAHEIAQAIRSLPASERDKLLHDIPHLFPELGGDAEWERIIHDERPRSALTQVVDEAEEKFRRKPGTFPELTERDFSSA